MSRKLVAAFLLLPALGSLIGGCKSKDSSQPAGTTATNPSQTAKMQQEEAAIGNLLADQSLKGKVAFIEFGQVGCSKSGEGLDEMISLYKDKSIASLNYLRVETSGDDQAVEAYYKAKAPPFAVYRDKGGKVAAAAGATVTPVFLLVDKFGHIRYRGSFPQDQLETWAAVLVAETADPGTDFIPLGAKDINYARLLSQTTLANLAGGKTKLADLAGAGGLLIFFGDTSCPYSEQALSELPLISGAMARHNIPAAVVNIDDAETQVRTYYQTHRPGVPILFDTTKATSNAWNINSVPTIILLKANGKAAYYGKAVWADLASAVEDALGLARGSVKFTAEGTSYG